MSALTSFVSSLSWVVVARWRSRGRSEMRESPESVVRRYLKAWEEPELEDLLSFFTDDAVYVDGPRGTHHGRDAIRTELQSQLAMRFSDVVMDVRAILTDGRTVMMEREDHFIIDGRRFSYGSMAVFEVEQDARISGWREYYDLQSVIDQIASTGFAPPPV